MSKAFIPIGVRFYGDYSEEMIKLGQCEPYQGKLPPLQHGGRPASEMQELWMKEGLESLRAIKRWPRTEKWLRREMPKVTGSPGIEWFEDARMGWFFNDNYSPEIEKLLFSRSSI